MDLSLPLIIFFDSMIAPSTSIVLNVRMVDVRCRAKVCNTITVIYHICVPGVAGNDKLKVGTCVSCASRDI
jgi:hypothetical protein